MKGWSKSYRKGYDVWFFDIKPRPIVIERWDIPEYVQQIDIVKRIRGKYKNLYFVQIWKAREPQNEREYDSFPTREKALAFVRRYIRTHPNG